MTIRLPMDFLKFPLDCYQANSTEFYTHFTQGAYGDGGPFEVWDFPDVILESKTSACLRVLERRSWIHHSQLYVTSNLVPAQLMALNSSESSGLCHVVELFPKPNGGYTHPYRVQSDRPVDEVQNLNLVRVGKKFRLGLSDGAEHLLDPKFGPPMQPLLEVMMRGGFEFYLQQDA